MPPFTRTAAHESVDVGILTVIPPELDAAKEALGPLQRMKESPEDTIFWRGAVRSELRSCDYTLVLAGIGAAGTSAAAAAAMEMIERFNPRVVLLVGIAAGMRDKVRIGEVVLSERIVAYEPAALTVNREGRREVQPRPEITRLSHGLQQDVLNYQPAAERLARIFARIKGEFPVPPSGEESTWKDHVAASVMCRSQVTIASGGYRGAQRDPCHAPACP
jgi:nucleoside phosphorylase